MVGAVHLDVQSDKVIAEIDDGVGWIVYNQPEKRNALSLEMQRGVALALDRYAQDDAVRVVVLRGAGDQAFISGADVSEFESQRASPNGQREFDRVWGEVARRFLELSKPVLAMIHGYCMGGGLATALFADIRIASEDAQFGIPAARLGLGYGYAGVERLVHFVGPAYASEILFSARRFSAEEALRAGLVNRVVSRGDLEPTVLDLSARIADNAPLTVRAAKAAISQAMRDPQDRDVAAVEALVRACFDSEDYAEGRRAFLEKRRPRFRGV